jgi:hypothetical protein
MYKISVPVMNANVTRCGREKVLKELKRFDTERVFLALDRYEADKEKRWQVMKELRENCAYFKANGFEVGAWVWAFMINGDNNYTCMRTINGTELRENICPLDEEFVEFAAGYIRDIAETGVDIIQFDDDFRYGFLGDSPRLPVRQAHGGNIQTDGG